MGFKVEDTPDRIFHRVWFISETTGDHQSPVIEVKNKEDRGVRSYRALEVGVLKFARFVFDSWQSWRGTSKKFDKMVELTTSSGKKIYVNKVSLEKWLDDTEKIDKVRDYSERIQQKLGILPLSIAPSPGMQDNVTETLTDDDCSSLSSQPEEGAQAAIDINTKLETQSVEEQSNRDQPV